MSVRRLIFEDFSQSFRVVIREEVVKQLFGLCEVNRSRETGGILIGFYSRDLTTAHVSEATIPPRDSRSGRDWFYRGANGLEELLHQRWHADLRTYYIGEWHFHTANVPWPSPQDQEQMHAVARDSRYRCAQPLLIIVCPARKGRMAVSCFVFPTCTSYEALNIVTDPGDAG